MLLPAIHADPRRCVDIPDSHVVKLILEVLMMCSVAFRARGPVSDVVATWLLRSTHEHHPYTRWVCSGDTALVWSLRLGKALCEEKRRRYPDNGAHMYETHYDALLDVMADVAQSMPYELQNDQLPHVSVSSKSVPDPIVREIITGATDRARGFRLYYWYTKRPNRRLGRFGGAAETLARRRHSRDAHVAMVPATWNEFSHQ